MTWVNDLKLVPSQISLLVHLSLLGDSIEQTIYEDIRNLHSTSDSSLDEVLRNANSTDLQWNEITGANLKQFHFEDHNFGVK